MSRMVTLAGALTLLALELDRRRAVPEVRPLSEANFRAVWREVNDDLRAFGGQS